MYFTYNQLGLRASVATPGHPIWIISIYNQIIGVEERINDVRDEARKGIAAVVALGVVIISSGPGKTAFHMGAGSYKGASAIGANICHRLGAEFFAKYNWQINAGVSSAGKDETVMRIGTAFEF